ncbi:MAG: hypothetical protein ACNA8W_20875 [Bradymonadaceae bacterium]
MRTRDRKIGAIALITLGAFLVSLIATSCTRDRRPRGNRGAVIDIDAGVNNFGYDTFDDDATSPGDDADPIVEVGGIKLTTSMARYERSASGRRAIIPLTLTNVSVAEPIPVGWSYFQLVTTEALVLQPSSASASSDVVCRNDVLVEVDGSVTCEVVFDIESTDTPQILRYVGVEGVTLDVNLILPPEEPQTSWDELCEYVMVTCGANLFFLSFPDVYECLENGREQAGWTVQEFMGCSESRVEVLLEEYISCSLELSCESFQESFTDCDAALFEAGC